jgi:hypothetical protein
MSEAFLERAMAEPMSGRCGHLDCAWHMVGPAAEVITAAAAHRERSHPDVGRSPSFEDRREARKRAGVKFAITY